MLFVDIYYAKESGYREGKNYFWQIFFLCAFLKRNKKVSLYNEIYTFI